MRNRTPNSEIRRFLPGRALVLMAMVASLLITSVPLAEQVEAQGSTEVLQVWGRSNGVVPDPKIWRFRQSTSAANALGSADAADPALDDSDAAGWVDQQIRWRDFPGPMVGNHFRKEFDIADIGVELFQIVGIQAELQYDDSAILYLNGVEVYRSIRGNLDPTYTLYPEGTNVPYDVEVPYGGAERFYVGIPNVNDTNTCERTGPTCPTSPYGDQNPPAIPVDLLVDGINVWSVTTWNQVAGSGDSSMDHTFSLLIDPDAVAPNPIFINEVVADNDGSWEVNTDADANLETPDWFELVNTSDEDVNIGNWTIEDATAAWTFPPSAVVPANGYLLVAASDNDSAGDPLQTNFKLSTEGDSLRLTNETGFIVDEYAVIPQQFSDSAYGQSLDDVDSAPVYLEAPTPGAANTAAGTDYDPILRLFANRMYNEGESIIHDVKAFDPDGDVLTYSLSPLPPGVSIDSTTGAITGSAIAAGTYPTTLTVTDADGRSAAQTVTWIVVPAVTGTSPIVLSEYNAVASDRDFLGGGVPLGNGGDWYEFLVIEDNLDLRGMQFELFDRKGPGEQLRLASTVTVGDDIRLANAPAGTLITISQDVPTDLNFNAVDDWHINLQVDGTGTGEFFGPASLGAVFNSTRDAQTVLIRDAAGNVVTPLSGETEAWDEAVAGVSGAEVMSLCTDMTPTSVLDPIADYRDNGAVSTFGEPNVCPDPLGIGTVPQSLDALRSAATLGAGSGDANCDGVVNVFDAVSAAKFFVGEFTDDGPCFFDQGGPGHVMYADGADINNDGVVNTFDAVIISRCIVGVPEPWCP